MLNCLSSSENVQEQQKLKVPVQGGQSQCDKTSRAYSEKNMSLISDRNDAIHDCLNIHTEDQFPCTKRSTASGIYNSLPRKKCQESLSSVCPKLLIDGKFIQCSAHASVMTQKLNKSASYSDNINKVDPQEENLGTNLHCCREDCKLEFSKLRCQFSNSDASQHICLNVANALSASVHNRNFNSKSRTKNLNML